MLRSLVIGRMGHFKDAETLAEARRRFNGHAAKGGLAATIRGVVYAIVAEHGATAEYKKLIRPLQGLKHAGRTRARPARADLF